MAETNTLKYKVNARSLQRSQEVEIWYALYKSLDVLCNKLDDDTGVTDTDYGALVVDAILNAKITNSQGNVAGYLQAAVEGSAIVSPRGLTDAQRHWMMYNYVNAWETLCEKLDADAGITDTNYEALWYTATFLHVVKDPKGVTDLGNGTVFYFTAGHCDRERLIEWLYNAVASLEGLTTKLDSDGGITDTDYEELTYETYCNVQIENEAGSIAGNVAYN
jgi:hypothetical protein